MPRLRSHSRTQSPSPSSSSSSASPSAAAAAAAAAASSSDVSPATPAPSPSSSHPLGLGRAAEHSKGASMATPRRSLRLAAAAAASPAPTTPLSSSPPASVAAAGSSSAGKRRGRAAALGPIATPKGLEFGNGGGAEARVSVGGGGGRGRVNPRMNSGGINNFRGLCVFSRRKEAIGEMEGDMELGLDGGADENMQPSGTGDEVLDEMLHKSEHGSAKRRKSELVEAIELDFVSNSGIEDNSEGKGLLDDDGGRAITPVEHAGRTLEIDRVSMGVDRNAESSMGVGSGSGARRHRFSPDMKGKEKMAVEKSSFSSGMSLDEFDVEQLARDLLKLADAPVEQPKPEMVNPVKPDYRREEVRKRAIELAPNFAFFKHEEDGHSDEDDAEDFEPNADPDEWPGPVSTAMRIIEGRNAKLRDRELNSTKLDDSTDVGISWAPSKDRRNSSRFAPSLKHLCLQVLSNNAEGIESLEGIPEELKDKLVSMLCCSRKMNMHLLRELVRDSPTTIRVSDCSWLTESEFKEIFGKCSTADLQVLQLELSGRCLSDCILPVTLARGPNSLLSLSKISLKGNYSLSDNGLDALISSAPSLSSLNLCQCSLLTSSGIEGLANKLNSVLRELYIDDCLNVEAMVILPALKRIKHLEVLSMSGIPTVCDKFVRELIPIHGSNIKELAFAGCSRLTTSSIKIIGENCPQLCSLDIRNLNRVRDLGMKHLAYGCHLIQKLKLRRNIFSDEAMALFLEESGGYLAELSLNNVGKAGNLTARAISRKCSSQLKSLDLSFCRKMTNEAVGLIVDSCSSLRILKLFGCTQITDVFLNGHSNSFVQIIGMEGTILDETYGH